MTDLAIAFGLVLVIEGLLWALFPNLARRLLEQLAETPEASVRAIAWSMVVLGVAIVWLVRG
jgi:uncharacterized protein